MRRRPVQGGAWEVVEELTGASSPRNFRWQWDVDTRTHGQVAPKKLLLNGSTPFTVGLDNPLADAEILEEDPEFGCCRVTAPDVARFDFAGEPMGPIPAAWTRRFTFEGRGTVAPVRIQGTPCSVAPPLASGATTDRVGSFTTIATRVVSVTASEDLAVAVLRVAVAGRRKTRLVVVAFDAAGDEVGRQHVTGGTSGFSDVAIEPPEAFRILHVLLEDLEPGAVPLASTGEELAGVLVLDSVECITAADMAQLERDRERCDRETSDGHGTVVPFLARHEYEIALTTEVGVKHSSTEWETTTITERVGFVTSGPPGLNETAEPGLELTPYVVSHPPGGNGLTYREESVHLVLSDRLRIFGPGSGTAEADFRMPVTLVVESAFDSVPARRIDKSSRESADWFLAHRGEADPWVILGSVELVRALSLDPRIGRYRALTEASTGTCPPDDVWNETAAADRPGSVRRLGPPAVGCRLVVRRVPAAGRRAGGRPRAVRAGRSHRPRRCIRVVVGRRRRPDGRRSGSGNLRRCDVGSAPARHPRPDRPRWIARRSSARRRRSTLAGHSRDGAARCREQRHARRGVDVRRAARLAGPCRRR